MSTNNKVKQIAELMDQAKHKDEQIFRLKEMLTQPEKKRQDVESLNQENDAEVPQLLIAVN